MALLWDRKTPQPKESDLAVSDNKLDSETIPVIFRAEKSGIYKGEVTAVFPTIPGTNGVWTCEIYARNGQHSSRSKDWYGTTRRALPSEYAALKRELESALFSYNLQVRKNWLPAFDDERRATLT